MSKVPGVYLGVAGWGGKRGGGVDPVLTVGRRYYIVRVRDSLLDSAKGKCLQKVCPQ